MVPQGGQLLGADEIFKMILGCFKFLAADNSDIKLIISARGMPLLFLSQKAAMLASHSQSSLVVSAGFFKCVDLPDEAFVVPFFLV